MHRLGYSVFLAVFMLLAAFSPALADMSGHYTGQGGDAGTSVDLMQQGTSVTGKVSGQASGTLSGTIAGTNLSGVVNLDPGIRYKFRATNSEGSLQITLFDDDGATELHSFALTGAAGDTGGGVAQTSRVEYWVYDNDTQYGPLTLNDVLARIGRGESNAKTQVWTQQLNAWVTIDTVPELASALTTTSTTIITTQPPGGTEYFTFDNNKQFGPLTAQQVLDRIKSGETNAGSQVWTQQLNAWVTLDKMPEFANALSALPGGGKQYFVFDNNQQTGPLGFEDVVARVKAGQSDRRTQVWTQQLNSWVLLDSQPEFAQAFAGVPAAATDYFVFDNNQQAGPLSLDQVLARIKSGESNGQTQVWTQALNKWVLIAEVPELAAALTTTPPADEQAANYYLYADGQQSGPFTHEQMLLGIAQGTVPRGTLIWMPGWDEWQKVEAIDEFAKQFAPMVPASVKYFVVENGERLGPLTDAQMIERITAGSTIGTDLAWKKGLEAWAPVSEFPEFAEALASVEEGPPPVPVIEEDQPPVVNDDEPPPMPKVDDGTGDDQGGIEVGPGGDDDVVTRPGDDEDAIDAALLGLVNERILRDMAGMPEDQQDAAISCIWDVLTPLTKDEKKSLVDVGLRPSPELVATFEANYPGITKQLDACGQQASIEVKPMDDSQPPVIDDQQPPVVDDQGMDQPPVVKGDEPPVVKDDQPPVTGGLDDKLRVIYGAQLEGMAGDVAPGVLDCLIKESAILTDAEKQMVIDERATDAVGEKVEASHPGFQNSLMACMPSEAAGGDDGTGVDTPPGQDTSTTTPGVTTPENNEDALKTAIRDSFKKQRLPDIYLESTTACVYSVLVSTLSETEKQAALAGMDMASAEQGAAMEAAHPGIQQRLAGCAPRTM